MGLSLEKRQGGVGSSGGEVFDEIPHEKPRRVAARQHEIIQTVLAFPGRLRALFLGIGSFVRGKKRDNEAGSSLMLCRHSVPDENPG